MRYFATKMIILIFVVTGLPSAVFAEQNKQTLVVSLMGNKIVMARYEEHFGLLVAQVLVGALLDLAITGNAGPISTSQGFASVAGKKGEDQFNLDKRYEDAMEKFLRGKYSIYGGSNKKDLMEKIRNNIVVAPKSEVRFSRDFKNEITPELKRINISRLVILAPYQVPGNTYSKELSGSGVLYDYTADKVSTFISAQASAFESSGKLIGRANVVSISNLELLRDYTEEEQQIITQFLEKQYQLGLHKSAQSVTEYRLIFEGRELSKEQRNQMQQKFDSDFDDLFEQDNSAIRYNFAN